MLLLDYARSLGVAMGSRYMGNAVGWTTNEDAATKLREAGARVVTGYGADGGNRGLPAGRDPKSADTPMGWEVSFNPASEVEQEAA